MVVRSGRRWMRWVNALGVASVLSGAALAQDDGALVGVPFADTKQRIDALDRSAGWHEPTWIVKQPNTWFVDAGVLRRAAGTNDGMAALALQTAETLGDVEVHCFWSRDGRRAERAVMRIEGPTVTLIDGLKPVFHGTLSDPGFAQARSLPAFAHWSLPSLTNGQRLGLLSGGEPTWLHGVAIRSLDGPVIAMTDDPIDGEAWRALGDAIYTIEGDVLRGVVGGGAQSFLTTHQRYGDFILDVDVRLDDAGNSGIQIRSTIRDDGRLFGPQIEIDPRTDRRWSGGFYDEGRRGWRQSLAANEAGRAAFDLAGWNRYRIECVGPRYRVWVNDVPTANVLDPLDLVGHIGFQVHSGNNTAVRWRRPRLRDLGEHTWRAMSADEWSVGGRLTVETRDPLLVLSASGEASASRERSLTAVTPAYDIGLHLRLRAPRGARIVTVAPGQGVGSVIARLTDGAAEVWRHADGHWVADLGAVLADGEFHDVHVLCIGDRRVVHVDGTVVHSLHGVADTAAPWALAIECPPSATVELEQVRLLARTR